MTDSLSVSSFENIYISPLVLKAVFGGYRFLSLKFFSFSNGKM